jgi:hypothetical protein
MIDKKSIIIVVLGYCLGNEVVFHSYVGHSTRPTVIVLGVEVMYGRINRIYSTGGGLVGLVQNYFCVQTNIWFVVCTQTGVYGPNFGHGIRFGGSKTSKVKISKPCTDKALIAKVVTREGVLSSTTKLSTRVYVKSLKLSSFLTARSVLAGLRFILGI